MSILASRAVAETTQELPRKLLPTRAKQPQTRCHKKRLLARGCLWRVGPSLDLQSAHNPKVAGSNPAPATNDRRAKVDGDIKCRRRAGGRYAARPSRTKASAHCHPWL